MPSPTYTGDGVVGVRQADVPDRLIDNAVYNYGGTQVYRQRVDVGSGTITLDSATLAALQHIQAVVSGTVALDAPTLAALEQITVSGTVALDAPTLAALETINAVCSGTVALDAPTIAALKNVTATVSGAVTVSGSVSVNNFPSSQAVTAASLPLPAGAATAAKQPAPGVAGTPSTDVLTVQGASGGTALPVSAAALPLPAGAATDTSVQAITTSLGADGATPPSIPGTGVRGWLRSIYDRLGGTLSVDGSAHVQPVSGTVSAQQAGAPWTVEVTDGTSVLGTPTHPIRTDPTGTTLQPVSGSVTANVGTTGGLALDATVNSASTQAHSDAATAHTDSAALLTSLGTDGATPPSVPGTGVRGWLRSIFDRLADGSQTTQILNIESDLFGTTIIGSLNNLIEVHYDDAAYASFLTVANVGAGAGPTQANGRVQWASGTTTSGSTTVTTLDAAVYRPHFPSYAAFTAAFVTPPTGATDLAVLGLGDLTNGVFVGYVGTQFGVLIRQGGVDTFVPQSSWSEAAVTITPSIGNIFKVEVGLFGYAGARVRWWNPSTRKWQTVHRVPWSNAEPFFTNFDLPMTLQIKKNASDATNIKINTACWGAGSSSLQTRMTDPVTDRSLAATVRAVIMGKSTAGGTNYVPVKVNPSGTLAIGNTSVGTTGTAVPTDATLIGGSDGTNLQAAYVDAKGIKAQDDYSTQVTLGDQTGAGAALTFTFSPAVDFVWVTDIGATSSNISRVVINGTASSTTGQPLLNMTPTPFPVRQITSVSVYAPAGSTINVTGYRRV